MSPKSAQRQFRGALAIIDTVQRAKCVAVAIHLLHLTDTEFNKKSAVAALLDGRVDSDAMLRQLYNVYGALVYTAIEGWMAVDCDWEPFADTRVDALLAETDLTVLRRFRNAVFHPAPMIDTRVQQYLEKFDGQNPRYHQIIDAIRDAIAPTLRGSSADSAS